MQNKKTTQINVRMDKTMADSLRLLANDLLTTPSQIVRKAVHDYLLKCKSSKRKG
jgi:predicted DNA-binding protein